jgi:hypothetical protein
MLPIGPRCERMGTPPPGSRAPGTATAERTHRPARRASAARDRSRALAGTVQHDEPGGSTRGHPRPEHRLQGFRAPPRDGPAGEQPVIVSSPLSASLP